ncbi:hypothetical protein FA13DRAFT_1501235 [Coprinellus micaceus]|uniref:Uncharacterized protein n=1 Tax=Coprinellus micaceus TaxID=71717 RepID=A0A4Y7TLD4_COPMI|nr:hypothetical protein FA13DRAFT_1501235 [Coprinellus micaceus]
MRGDMSRWELWVRVRVPRDLRGQVPHHAPCIFASRCLHRADWLREHCDGGNFEKECPWTPVLAFRTFAGVQPRINIPHGGIGERTGLWWSWWLATKNEFDAPMPQGDNWRPDDSCFEIERPFLTRIFIMHVLVHLPSLMNGSRGRHITTRSSKGRYPSLTYWPHHLVLSRCQ